MIAIIIISCLTTFLCTTLAWWLGEAIKYHCHSTNTFNAMDKFTIEDIEQEIQKFENMKQELEAFSQDPAAEKLRSGIERVITALENVLSARRAFEESELAKTLLTDHK